MVSAGEPTPISVAPLESVPALVAGVLLLTPASPAAQSNPFVGSWNISGTGPDAAIDNHWLGIKEEGGKLTGSFLAARDQLMLVALGGVAGLAGAVASLRREEV